MGQMLFPFWEGLQLNVNDTRWKKMSSSMCKGLSAALIIAAEQKIFFTVEKLCKTGLKRALGKSF
jgi:hypothetical protein